MIDNQKRADIVNGRTLTVEVDVINPTWWQKLRKKTKLVYEVRQPSLGVLEQIGALSGRIKSVEQTAEVLPMIFGRLQNDAKAQIEILACLFESKAYPSQSVKNIISKNILPNEALSLISNLFEFANLSDFINSTILMKGMGLTKSEEIIAPQELKNESEERKTSGEQ